MGSEIQFNRNALHVDQLGDQLFELVAGDVELAGERARGETSLLFEDFARALELRDEAHCSCLRGPFMLEGPPP